MHQQAADILNAATGNNPRYVVSLVQPTGGVNFTATVEPSHIFCTNGSAAAFINVRGENRLITGGEITYCSAAFARTSRIIAHELGHSTGLFHSDAQDIRDVMSCTFTQQVSVFSPREILAMKLMRQRLGGNEWPDRDRPMFPSSPASTGPMSTVFVCPG